MEQRLINLGQACKYLQISKPTMYNYLKQNKIKAFKPNGGRLWKFDLKDLEQWIDKQKNEQ
jgi:excisionase family DNA binding protein